MLPRPGFTSLFPISLSLHCPFPLSFIPLYLLTSPPCIPCSPSERLLPLHLATMLSQASAIVFCMKACWYCLKWSSLTLCRLVGRTLELPGKTKSLWSPKGASRRTSLHTESSLLIFSQQMINQKARKYEVTSAEKQSIFEYIDLLISKNYQQFIDSRMSNSFSVSCLYVLGTLWSDSHQKQNVSLSLFKIPVTLVTGL